MILFIKTMTEALDCFGKNMKKEHVSHQNKGLFDLLYVAEHMGLYYYYAVFSWDSGNLKIVPFRIPY